MITQKRYLPWLVSFFAGVTVSSVPSVSMAEEGAPEIPAVHEPGVIVITGERVGRSQQDTAASVAVFDSERLEQLPGADRIEQVLEQVPNLQLGSGDIGVTIRGQDTTGVLIGANAFLGGSRPRSTLVVDGRAVSYNESIYGIAPLWDVEQIEVFRGPQTTTQGRNAIAGAVFIDTRDPTFEAQGAGRVILGNANTRQASVALSGPLVNDQLAMRVVVDWRQHESWMNYSAADLFVGADREDDNYANIRTKLLFQPAAIPDLELLLTYNHLQSGNPQGETADQPYGERRQSVQNGAHWDTDVDSVVLDASYLLTDAWEASLLTTFADSRSERFAASGFGTAVVTADEYSLEGLLRYNPAAGRSRGIVGLSYYAADQDETSDFSAFLGLGRFTDKQSSAGVFGEMTVDITPRLHFTVGGRWQQDSQDREGSLGRFNVDYDESFNAFLPKAELAYDLNSAAVIGVSARKGYNPGGTTVSFTTGRIDEFDAETLWSYELFSRASLAEGALVLSGNLFYTDFDNAQRQLFSIVTLANGSMVEQTEFSNAPAAESYGFEAEALWKVSPDLDLRASLGYLKTRITDTLQSNDPILNQEFQRAPRFTVALGLNMRPVKALTLDIGVRSHSGYYSDDSNTPEFRIAGKTLLDARATYDFGDLRAFAYGRNLTDKTYPVWQFRPGNAFLGDPREFGIGIETAF